MKRSLLAISAMSLLLGMWAFCFYFGNSFNSNDVVIMGGDTLSIKQVSQNKFIITFIIANMSDTEITGVGAVINVYDDDSWCVGHGELTSSVALEPRSGHQFECEVYMDMGHKSIHQMMIAPCSDKGTGKILTVLL